MNWHLLSTASSQASHTCSTDDHRNCRGCRWFEVSLSRAALDGAWWYQVEMIGRSTIDGETDRVRVEQTTSPHAVIDFLALGPTGQQYINKTARKALHEAGDIDQALADALDDFDSLVRR